MGKSDVDSYIESVFGIELPPLVAPHGMRYRCMCGKYSYTTIEDGFQITNCLACNTKVELRPAFMNYAGDVNFKEIK